MLSPLNASGPPPDWTPEKALAVAESILPGPWTLEGEKAYHECPGASLHSHGINGRKDFTLYLRGNVPSATCFHSHCSGAVAEFNREFYRRLFAGQRSSNPLPPAVVAQQTPEPPKKRQPFDLAALRRAQLPGLFVDESWLASRSPIPVDHITPSRFLANLYQPGERVITFTNQISDGNYGARIGPCGTVTWVQLHAYKCGTPTEIGPPFDDPARLRDPRTTITPEGAWFLAQPVDGKWHLNPDSIDRHTGLPKYSRRSRHSVTAWRYLVLESDDAPTHLWLNLLVQLHLPIAALYTSGGRSIHALVRIDAPSKAHFDDARDSLMPLLSTLGADPAAMTAVRLTRLPGTYRCGKTVRETINGRPVKRFHPFPQPLLQRLLYLNPTPNATPIITQPQHRQPSPVA